MWSWKGRNSTFFRSETSCKHLSHVSIQRPHHSRVNQSTAVAAQKMEMWPKMKRKKSDQFKTTFNALSRLMWRQTSLSFHAIAPKSKIYCLYSQNRWEIRKKEKTSAKKSIKIESDNTRVHLVVSSTRKQRNRLNFYISAIRLWSLSTSRALVIT